MYALLSAEILNISSHNVSMRMKGSIPYGYLNHTFIIILIKTIHNKKILFSGRLSSKLEHANVFE